MSARQVVTLFVLVGFVAFMAGGCGKKVSQGNYDKIKDGMTVSEVKGILGEPTEQAGALGAAGSGTVMAWKDGDKEIAVTFKDDKVVAKVQKGL